MVDFNDDGALDILYTAGDNADYSNVRKPYHGVYIFLNRGNARYEPVYFHHFDGATDAVAADFDGDGDLDIAAIGFFAAVDETGAGNVLFLEQEQRAPDGSLQFVPYEPAVQPAGRWISMAAGDYDGDGDLDLVLGNFAQQYAATRQVAADTTRQEPFVILENTTFH